MGEKRMIRFGILGCGTVAQIHAQAIALLENACLAGAAGTSADSARKFTQLHGGRAYDSFAQMLADDTVDVVCICTPSFCHVQQATAALEHSKHVVLEKPMALTAEEADSLVRRSREKGLLLTVVSQMRFAPDVQLLRTLVEEAAFGKLTGVSLTMRYWREPSYFSESSWRGRKACEGGGALMNQGIHGIDLLQYLVGTPRILAARAATLHHNVEVEDTAFALFETDCCIGTITASTCAYPGFERRLELYGTRGYAVLREDKLEKLQIPGHAIDGICAATSTGSRRPEAIGCRMHLLQLENMANAIRGDAPLLLEPEEGVKAVRIIEEIYKKAGI